MQMCISFSMEIGGEFNALNNNRITNQRIKWCHFYCCCGFSSTRWKCRHYVIRRCFTFSRCFFKLNSYLFVFCVQWLFAFRNRAHTSAKKNIPTNACTFICVPLYQTSMFDIPQYTVSELIVEELTLVGKLEADEHPCFYRSLQKHWSILVLFYLVSMKTSHYRIVEVATCC